MNHSGILKIAMAKIGSTFVNFRLGGTNINWVMNCLQTSTNHIGDSHFPRELLAANILGRHDSCDFWSPRGASCLVKQLGKKHTHRIKANHRVNQSTSDDVICFVPKKSRGFGEIYSKKMLKLIATKKTRKNQWMLWKASFRHVSVDRLSILWSITRAGSCFGNVACQWPINLFSCLGLYSYHLVSMFYTGLTSIHVIRKHQKPKPKEVPMVNKLHATHLHGEFASIQSYSMDLYGESGIGKGHRRFGLLNDLYILCLESVW